MEKTIQSLYDYDDAWHWLERKGRQTFGNHFRLYEEDRLVINQLLCYFFRDVPVAEQLNIRLNKGILLSGPVGCGKTSLMSLLRHVPQDPFRHIMKSCRDISFEFIKDGPDVIQRYSTHSFYNARPRAICFDDLGTEKNLKYFGNECNVMAEIILSRYDLFVTRSMLTHLNTNLSAGELEAAYGRRVRSRLREMFNLISFDNNCKDKRR